MSAPSTHTSSRSTSETAQAAQAQPNKGADLFARQAAKVKAAAAATPQTTEAAQDMRQPTGDKPRSHWGYKTAADGNPKAHQFLPSPAPRVQEKPVSPQASDDELATTTQAIPTDTTEHWNSFEYESDESEAAEIPPARPPKPNLPTDTTPPARGYNPFEYDIDESEAAEIPPARPPKPNLPTDTTTPAIPTDTTKYWNTFESKSDASDALDPEEVARTTTPTPDTERTDKTDAATIKATAGRIGSKEEMIALLNHAYSLVKQCEEKITFIDNILSIRVTNLIGSRSKTMLEVNEAIQQKKKALEQLSGRLSTQTQTMEELALTDESQNPRMINTLTELIGAAENDIQYFNPKIIKALHKKNTATEQRYGQLAATITGNVCKITKSPIVRLIMTEAQANQALAALTAAQEREDHTGIDLNYPVFQVKGAEANRLLNS